MQTNTFNDYLNNTKLSTKIVGTIIIITFAIFGLISYFINDAVRSNTLEAEKDKAEILLDSLSADISMDIYLGLLDDSREKVSKLLKRDEVLKITVKAMPSDKILISESKNADALTMQEAIVVKKEVRDGFTGAVVTDIELYYSNKNYSKMMEKFRVIAANLIAIFLIAILLILTLIKHFLRPLNNIASKISSYKPGSNVEFDIPDSKCETGVIVTAFKMMQENINDYANKLEDINQNLETEVASKTAELVELNNDLKKRVEEEIEKRVEKDKLLIQQSRLAIMGEMISMIAHQWRQPLNTLAIMIQDTAFQHSTSQLSKEDMEQFTNDCMKTIQKMSKTVDDFRSFFRPNNPREEFSIEGAIRDTLSVAEAMFASDNIAIVFDSTSEHHITGYKNELEQVILILLTNAKDALVENNISNPHIQITVENIENDTVEIVVRDNGSGIPLDIMDKIFDPYFSTKNKNSSGIGLYMSKEIIERQMKGSISVKNNKDGAEFSIAIK